MLERARKLDEEVAARRGATYAGDADPYKKPREVPADDADLDEDDDEDDDELALSPAWSSSTSRRG